MFVWLRRDYFVQALWGVPRSLILAFHSCERCFLALARIECLHSQSNMARRSWSWHESLNRASPIFKKLHCGNSRVPGLFVGKSAKCG
ncbi:hypothetical protein AVEN_120430-1 [Araneus ventricosus]|uniref:Uncharacterized protein n=1 Tax=Araneus ventricosus TaxID=182803 RepID=A0A4Y2L6X7_ARAVE|nr:hypothetical protein AVEN_120430-1 [Araneus ventricosus]